MHELLQNISFPWVLVLRINFTLLRHFFGKSNSLVGYLILLLGDNSELVPSESAPCFSFSIRCRSSFIVKIDQHSQWYQMSGRISGFVSSFIFKIGSNFLICVAFTGACSIHKEFNLVKFSSQSVPWIRYSMAEFYLLQPKSKIKNLSLYWNFGQQSKCIVPCIFWATLHQKSSPFLYIRKDNALQNISESGAQILTQYPKKEASSVIDVLKNLHSSTCLLYWGVLISFFGGGVLGHFLP